MKRNSDRRSENTIVFSYLRTYLIVLIIPLIICSLYCGRVISILERDDTLQAVEKLRYSETSVDTLLEEAEGVGSMILNNVSVQNFTGKADALQYPNTYSIIGCRGHCRIFPIQMKISTDILFSLIKASW